MVKCYDYIQKVPHNHLCNLLLIFLNKKYFVINRAYIILRTL
jgi:hypothetical protein